MNSSFCNLNKWDDCFNRFQSGEQKQLWLLCFIWYDTHEYIRNGWLIVINGNAVHRATETFRGKWKCPYIVKFNWFRSLILLMNLPFAILVLKLSSPIVNAFDIVTIYSLNPPSCDSVTIIRLFMLLYHEYVVAQAIANCVLKCERQRWGEKNEQPCMGLSQYALQRTTAAKTNK